MQSPKNLLIQFIPILLVTLFLLYTTQMVKYSRTILGKIIALSIVIFYTFIDPLYGVFFCVIIILCYQTVFEFNQYTEGMDTNCNTNSNHNHMNSINEPAEKKSDMYSRDELNYVANNMESSNLGSFIQKESCLINNDDPIITINENIKFEEGMVTYSSSKNEQKINQEEGNIDNETIDKDRIDFENNHCDNGVLRYKGSKINLEMATLVLPQLKYKGKNCNPCDKSCDYNIDNKLMFENEILRPKESNSMFKSVWDIVWKSNKNDPIDYDGKIYTPSTTFYE